MREAERYWCSYIYNGFLAASDVTPSRWIPRYRVNNACFVESFHVRVHAILPD